MFSEHYISTNVQKVLAYFCLNQGKECYEREVAKGANISFGSANNILRKLHKEGILRRSIQGRMCYYNVDLSATYLKEYKILVNLLMIEPLIEKIKPHGLKIVLYGSWANGTDNIDSDIDLFIVSSEKGIIRKIINKYSNSKKFQGRKVQAIIYEPADMLIKDEKEKVFLKQVEKGKVLWDRSIDEDNI